MRHRPYGVAALAPELVEDDVGLAEVLDRALLFLGDVGAVMLLRDAGEGRLNLRLSHALLRAGAHSLDGFIEQAGVAAECVGKIELLAPVAVLLASFSFARGRRWHADRPFLTADHFADRQLHRSPR